MFKKISSIILLILTTITFVNSAGINESFTDIEIDYDGFCPNFDIDFKIYNATEFAIKDEIEDDLCGADETPEDDGCSEFTAITGSVKIYDGPIDGLPILLDTTLSTTGEFTYKFTEGNDFLVQIIPTGNYNNLETFIEIQECMRATNNPNRIVDEVEETIEIKNQTFSYNNYEHILKLEATDLLKADDINITNVITPLSKGLPDIDQEYYKIIEIEGASTTFTNFEIETSTIEDDVELEILKYNVVTQSWGRFDGNPDKKINRLHFNITQYGIYAVVKKEELIEEIVTIVEDETQTNETAETFSTTEDDIQPIVVEKEISFGDPKIIFGIIIILGGIVLFFAIPRKQKETNYHDYRVQPLNSETYNKTKDYVQKFKVKYNENQIRQSLTKAKIDSVVIDKVLAEEFPANKEININDYKKTKAYVQKYKMQYSKEQLKTALIKAKTDPRIIEKVVSEEF